MNLIRSDDKKYINPWYPFMGLFEDEELFPTKVSGMNMWEDENKVYVEVAVPGLAEKDIDVQLENGVLSIRAAKSSSEEKEEKGKKVYVSSMKSNYYYSTTLPSSAGHDVDATLENGVLKVEVAKRQETLPKKITVRKK